jgi:hypothetical protein
VLPPDYECSSKFYHIVKFPEWCGEDCQCEGKTGDGCPYDNNGECGFKPYVSRISPKSVNHALYILSGLSLTREAADAALKEAGE